MHLRKLQYWTAALALTSLLLAACGGPAVQPTPVPPTATPVPPTATPEPEPPTPTTATSGTTDTDTSGTSLEGGWTLYERPDDGFVIALEPNWKNVDLSAGDLEQSLGELKDVNPAMSEALAGQASSLLASGVKFWAIDTESNVEETGTVTNLNIIVTESGGITLDQFAELGVAQTEAQLKTMLADPIEHERVELSGGEAEKLTYSLNLASASGGQSSQALTQYVFVEGDKLYILTFTTAKANAADNASTFEDIADTFQPVD